MGNNLKSLRISRGWTHEKAADRMGVSRGHYIKLERGERKLAEHTIVKAARAFEVPQAEVFSDETPIVSPSAPPGAPSTDVNDLKVFAAVEGGPGLMVVSTDPIELVQRPWYMGKVREGYAVLIVGDSMEPVFEPGDMAVVNPRLPHRRNTDVILVSGEQEGQFTATIKRLVDWTAKDWLLRQFNPKKDFKLPRREWPKALRVVGKYYGR